MRDHAAVGHLAGPGSPGAGGGVQPHVVLGAGRHAGEPAGGRRGAAGCGRQGGSGDPSGAVPPDHRAPLPSLDQGPQLASAGGGQVRDRVAEGARPGHRFPGAAVPVTESGLHVVVGTAVLGDPDVVFGHDGDGTTLEPAAPRAVNPPAAGQLERAVAREHPQVVTRGGGGELRVEAPDALRQRGGPPGSAVPAAHRPPGPAGVSPVLLEQQGPCLALPCDAYRAEFRRGHLTRRVRQPPPGHPCRALVGAAHREEDDEKEGGHQSHK